MNSEIVIAYLEKFPNLPSKTLADKIYSDHSDKFLSAESVRNMVRYRRGKSGKENRNYVAGSKFVNQKPIYRYDIPDADPINFQPY